jgi:hypothetical protein
MSIFIDFHIHYQLIDNSRVNQLLNESAIVGSDGAWRLTHVDADELLLGVDPEVGTGITGPHELSGCPWNAGNAAALAHGKAEPEGVTGGAEETSISLFGWPLARSTASGWATRPILPLGTQNAVSCIFSGSNSRSARKSPRRLPEPASTTRPSKSTARLYSQIVPG